DLPALGRLTPEQRRWTIVLKADPKAEFLAGRFDRIGDSVDPSQHTALVMGWVDNSSGTLRIGQFVTARIELPAAADEVAVPLGALVDLDGNSYIFTRSAHAPWAFTRHRVHPVRRFENFVVIDCPNRAGSSTAQCEFSRLQAGDTVVTIGGIEL